MRIAVTIMFETAALIVWNVGTRPPQALLADVRRALGAPAAVISGLIRFAAGIGLVIVGAGILIPTLPDAANEFVPLEIFTFVAALICEVLIGNDIRRLMRKN